MSGRRLLLVSYHFPPSEAAGALRWQRLATIGAQYGWVVDAITLAPNLVERADWGRVAELPSTTRIHGVTRPEPLAGQLELAAWRVWRALRHGLETGEHRPAGDGSRPGTVHRTEVGWRGGHRALRRISNVLLDYARENAWSRAAVMTGLRCAAKHRPDLVLSCGPPHRVHQAGRRLARALGIPFVMDMRDPWSLQVRLHEEMASPLWFHLAAREEARCVADADLIVMNTPLAAEAMRKKWPRKRILAVLNGWDAESLPQLSWPEQFRVVYAGTIYLDRTPQPFFRAVAAAVRRLGAAPKDFEVRLIGSVASFGGRSVAGLAAEEGIGDYVRVIPPLSRQEILREYAEAALLLSLPQDSDYAIPSKVFEYMCQPCWLMAQTVRDSATAGVLEDSSAFVVAPEDVARMTEILVRCYGEFRAGCRPDPVVRNGRFSRASEGAKLFAALASLVPTVPQSD